MLTRRHIRVKVMQAIYALNQSNEQSLETTTKFLNTSMAQMYTLYLLNLSMLIELHHMANERLKLEQKRYLKSESFGNAKVLAHNLFLTQLSQNTLINDALNKRKITNWYLNEDYVKIIFQEILNHPIYQAYIDSSLGYEEDKARILFLFKEVIAPNEKLYDYFEDERITWTDDIPIINTFFVKRLKNAKENARPNYFLPTLLKDEEDMNFAKTLLEKTILHNEKWEADIEDKTPNWDKERIAEVDHILLKMALCEFESFSSIPEKVTINEYLEIAKEYSTPKSSLFINGILDKLAKEFNQTGRMHKVGRGLL